MVLMEFNCKNLARIQQELIKLVNSSNAMPTQNKNIFKSKNDYFVVSNKRSKLFLFSYYGHLKVSVSEWNSKYEYLR